MSVAFVHSEESKNKEIYRIEESDNDGIRELRVYFQKASSPFGVLNKLINLKRYLKGQEMAYKKLFPTKPPNLVHVHVLARSSMLALKLLKKEIPFVITEHWSGYLPESSALKKSGKAPWYKRIGLKAKGIHTVTQNLAKAMQAHGIKNEYTVIPNVVKEDLFLPKTEKGQSEKLQILYVGNILQHPKRILDILDVFQSISKIRNDFQLTIYGEGIDEPHLRQKIKDYELEKVVLFKGTANRAGIANAMGKADFLFLFSEFENQPCVINEALCCGTPVVVPNIEGIVEFMFDDYGLVFNRLNQAAFQESLLKMMDTCRMYDTQKIRKLAVAQFGEEAIAQQFLSFYKKALNQ